MTFEERSDAEFARYRGLNPAFVRKVWAKRRAGQPRAPRRTEPRIPRWSEEERALVRKMLVEGKTAGQISLKLVGRSQKSVIGLVNRDPELRAVGFNHPKSKYANKSLKIQAKSAILHGPTGG